jgi:hypothetical protein
MPFLKRSLMNHEISAIDFKALGIETRRVPGENWSWAVDENARVYFTQLISSTNEMREGDYWYLLLIEGCPVVLQVNAWGGKPVDGNIHLRAKFISGTTALKCPVAGVEALASEAMEVVSAQRDRLAFR